MLRFAAFDLHVFISVHVPTELIRRSMGVASFVVHKMQRYFPNTCDDSTIVRAEPEAISAQIQRYVHKIKRHVKADARGVDGGLYVGVSGVGYMFYHIAKNPDEEQTRHTSNPYLCKALDYLNPALQHPAKDKTSFLLGDAGSQALACAVHHKLKDREHSVQFAESYKALHEQLLKDFLKCGSDELFVGRAGYIAGALWLSRELRASVLPRSALHALCAATVRSGREYARAHRSPCPLMYAYYKTQYLGAAHGLAAILQMLITVPGYLASDAEAAADVRATIDYVLSLQAPDGNWPCTMKDVGRLEHDLVHWCHGAPGVVYLMARAFVVYDDPRYYKSCVRAAECVWRRGLLRKGPGICHGIAGSGYVFLLLYRLSKDEKYLSRAHAFAAFLQTQEFAEGARVPDSPFSLYEGTAGTVCFLSDLLTPMKAEFPFQDVFTDYEPYFSL